MSLAKCPPRRAAKPQKLERCPDSATRRRPGPSDETSAPLPPALSPAHAAMLTEYTPIVRQIAGGFQRRLPRNVLRDDLVAAGMSGLWDAIVKHGKDRGESFDWYVRVRIRGAILDELRAQDWLPRRARAAAALAAVNSGGAAPGAPVVLRFDDVSETEQARCLIASDAISGEQHLEEKNTRAAIAKAVEQLPERERHIVAMHYFKGVKFKELGHMLGVSEPRISQLHSRAMGRLKLMLAQEAA